MSVISESMPSQGEVANSLRSVHSGWRQLVDANGNWGFFHKEVEIAYIDGTGKFNFSQGFTYTNLPPPADNVNTIGTASLRWASISAVLHNVFGTVGDANPTSQLSSATLSFGAGGASALDSLIQRANASTWIFGNASVSDNVGQLGSATFRLFGLYAGPTGYNVTHTAADANPTAQFGDATLKFGAGGASALDTILSRLAANTWGFGADNVGALGSATVRLGALSSGNGYYVYHASADANASAAIGDGVLKFGAGGASALDVTLTRVSAGFASVPSLRIDGNAALVAAATMITTDVGGGTGDLQFQVPTGDFHRFYVNAVEVMNIQAAQILMMQDLFGSTDNARSFGSATTRWRNLNFANLVNGYLASGDANPVVQLLVSANPGIKMGAGGGSAVDTSITRAGAAQLATESKFTTYNNRTTSGNGLMPIWASTNQKSESAADANVLTLTPPATAGSYKIRIVISVSAASAAVLGWTATWKDSNGNAQAPTNLPVLQNASAGGNGSATSALTFTTSAASNYGGEIEIDIDNSQTNIVIKFTLTGGTVTAKVTATIMGLIG